MPYVTANARLRKNILFGLLQRHHENICFVCSQPITYVKDLSIEHIQPWEGVDVALFWDVRNIAFSHVQCNRPHNYRGNALARRKKSPDGMAWCRRCKNDLSQDNFNKNRTRWNGLQAWCKSCMKQRNR